MSKTQKDKVTKQQKDQQTEKDFIRLQPTDKPVEERKKLKRKFYEKELARLHLELTQVASVYLIISVIIVAMRNKIILISNPAAVTA